MKPTPLVMTLPLAFVIGLVGCSSPEPRDEPRPHPAQRSADVVALERRLRAAEAALETERARTRQVQAAARRIQAKSELLEAQRDERRHDMRHALAQAIASLRLQPTHQAADFVLTLRRRLPQRLLWASPRGENQNSPGHRRGITALAFSPDGRSLASGSFDESVRAWDVATGLERARLEGLSGAATALAFSPAGFSLAAQSRDDVREWDLTTTLELEPPSDFKPPAQAAHSWRWSVTANANGLVHVQAEAVMDLQLAATDAWLTAYAFSPDGQLLATGSADSVIRLWNLRPVALSLADGFETALDFLDFNADGTRLVTGSASGSVCLWDTATGKWVGRWDSPGSRLLALGFGQFDEILAYYEQPWEPGAPNVVGLNSGREIAALEYPNEKAISATFSADGSDLAVTMERWSFHLNLSTGDRRLLPEVGAAAPMAFTLDGASFAAMTMGGSVGLWDVATGERRAATHIHAAPLTTTDDFRCGIGFRSTSRPMAFSPDGGALALLNEEHQLRLWDLKTTSEHPPVSTRGRYVTAFAFSPAGQSLAVGDTTVRLLDIASGDERAQIGGPMQRVTDLVFSPDGSLLAAVESGRYLRIWDVATGAQRLRLGGHAAEVDLVAISPDGRQLASRDTTGEVLIWDIAAGVSLGNLGSAEAQSMLAAWSAPAYGTSGPPAQRPGLPPLLSAEELAWRHAWWDQDSDEPGLPNQVKALLDRWERDINLRVDLESGELQPVPAPGSAYADQPRIAERCR